MKKIILAIFLLFSGVVSLQAESSLTDELKNASSGSISSRFRFGYYGGIGYQGRLSGDGDTRIQGLLLEGGVYALFNPVRNYFDLEIGISGKYNTGAEVSSSNNIGADIKYYAGLKQVTVYSGAVFRFGESKRALSVGISKALYIDEVLSDDMKDDNIKKHDLDNGIGAYLEYQTDLFDGTISFIRLEVERVDIKNDIQDTTDTVGSILFGVKF